MTERDFAVDNIRIHAGMNVWFMCKPVIQPLPIMGISRLKR